MKLVTPAMLDAVRKVGAAGLQTDVTILRRSLVEQAEGDDDEEVWAVVGTYKGWVRMDNNPRFEPDSGRIVSSGNFRIHLDPSVSVDEGDLARVDGQDYLVNDVNTDDTYRVFTTLMARRAQ